MYCFSRFLIFLILITMPMMAEAARIDKIVVEVQSEESLPPMVKERMEESIAAIGEQLILGHSLPFDEVWLRQQELTIHTVFDKILVGYTVKNVEITNYEAMAIINVNLIAWSNTIEKVQVNTHVEGMPPELEELVRRDLAKVDDVFSDGLLDLPVAAADWTNGVLKRQLNDFMTNSLPEFRADFDIDFQGNDVIVDLTVYPRLPVVRTVSLSMRSDTMPNVALVTHRTLMEDKVNILVGVPVAFVDRHKEDIESILAKLLDEQTDFRVLKIKSNVTFNAAEQMSVMIRSDSSRYKMRATGWLDIGRSSDVNDDLVFRLHIGRNLSNIDEAFFLVDIQPQAVHWKLSAGYMRNVIPGMETSLRYDFKDKDFIASIEHTFLKNWLIRYEHRFDNDENEAAVRYKLHDFLGVECVVDDKESWIRLIGNF